MSKKQTYTQCELHSWNKIWVAWIPTKFAKKNKTIRIDGLDGDVIVNEVYGTKDADYVIKKSYDHTRQRKASDV